MQGRYAGLLHELEHTMVIEGNLVDAMAVIRQAESAIPSEKFLEAPPLLLVINS